MAPALLVLVLGFNIRPVHSTVDMGNQSPAACKFCIVCERLTIPIAQSFIIAGEGLLPRSLKFVIKFQGLSWDSFQDNLLTIYHYVP